DTVRPQMPAVSSISDPITLDTVSTRSAPTVWAPDTKTMLFFGSEESTHGTEQFRALRSQLYQLREKQPLRKILVTSSVPGEGRSFVAANLAQVMARQPGCRALLIDADLRNPSLHLTLGTSASPGLSEYLLGEADESGIIQRGQMENLFFLASGRPVSGPTEIISNGRLKSIMDCLETLFDWIIIDSPAAIPVSDSGLIANLCDGVLMVVRSNATPFDLVRKARQKFNPDRLLGVVLNGVPPEIDPQIQY
ncbi:MAG: CpsD/CapB family tyrosine-protein kinase, partial [Candidatus Sulfotelmatobacter sp.]